MPEFMNKRSYVIIIALIVISMAILTIHFREGENGPLHRAQRVVLATTSPLQNAVTTILQPVKDGWDYLVNFGDLKRENRALKQEALKLRSELSSLRNLKAENARLRKIIGFKEKQAVEGIPAHVIGKPSSNWRSSVIVDQGSRDGVKRSMPVVVGGSLIGQVVDVSRGVAKVALLNDVQSGVSVQVKRTGEVGVIKGQLKNRRLQLHYISRESTIKQGDRIYTSGLGGIFPKGIYVGKAARVKQSPYNLYKAVEVAPLVDFTNLEEVFIIRYQPGFGFSEEGGGN